MSLLLFYQLYSSCTLSCSIKVSRSLLIFCLVRSVSTSEARSLASASSSQFIFTEGDLVNKPIFYTVDNRLKYRAICCSINRSVLDNISGWCRLLNSILGKSHQRRLPYQFPPLSSTRLGDDLLLSEKRWLFLRSRFLIWHHYEDVIQLIHLHQIGLTMSVALLREGVKYYRKCKLFKSFRDVSVMSIFGCHKKFTPT